MYGNIQRVRSGNTAAKCNARDDFMTANFRIMKVNATCPAMLISLASEVRVQICLAQSKASRQGCTRVITQWACAFGRRLAIACVVLVREIMIVLLWKTCMLLLPQVLHLSRWWAVESICKLQHAYGAVHTEHSTHRTFADIDSVRVLRKACSREKVDLVAGFQSWVHNYYSLSSP